MTGRPPWQTLETGSQATPDRERRQARSRQAPGCARLRAAARVPLRARARRARRPAAAAPPRAGAGSACAARRAARRPAARPRRRTGGGSARVRPARAPWPGSPPPPGAARRPCSVARRGGQGAARPLGWGPQLLQHGTQRCGLADCGNVHAQQPWSCCLLPPADTGGQPWPARLHRAAFFVQADVQTKWRGTRAAHPSLRRVPARQPGAPGCLHDLRRVPAARAAAACHALHAGLAGAGQRPVCCKQQCRRARWGSEQ